MSFFDKPPYKGSRPPRHTAPDKPLLNAKDPGLRLGQFLKEHGMGAALDGCLNSYQKAQVLALARSVVHAAAVGRSSLLATTNDWTEYQRTHGLTGKPDILGHAAGSIFKGGDWTKTDDRVQSILPSNHARELCVWKLGELEQHSETQPETLEDMSGESFG